jgi:aminomethyltransferase
MEAEVGGVRVLVSQTGFTGEKGYEVYVRDASQHAETVWHGILDVGRKHGLAVVAPAHHRRIAAGILSWGQDMDFETSPFQVNLGYQVPRKKTADYIGKRELERQRTEIDAGRFPFKLKLVGLRLGGRPITDYASDFWLVSTVEGRQVGYVTSPWWSPELESNIALAFVPVGQSEIGTELRVELPEPWTVRAGEPVEAEVCAVPFRPSVNPSAREIAARRGLDYAD